MMDSDNESNISEKSTENEEINEDDLPQEEKVSSKSFSCFKFNTF